MKRVIHVVCLTIALSMSVYAGVEKSDNLTWTNDWSAFVKQLSSEVGRANYFADNVNLAFAGKRVEWEGKISEVTKPTKPGESGKVTVAMRSETIQMTGLPKLEKLILTPEADEWESWQGVSVGATVRFVTTLELNQDFMIPKCVLTYMQGMGKYAGQAFAYINTKGGKCLTVNPRSENPK